MAWLILKVTKMKQEKITTIKVRVSTRDRLAKHALYGDTMDIVINRIIDKAERCGL